MFGKNTTIKIIIITEGKKMNNSNPLEHKQRCMTSEDVTGAPFINTIKGMCPTPLPKAACFQL